MFKSLLKQLVVLSITLFFVTDVYAQSLVESLNKIRDHVSGANVLSSSELVVEKSKIQEYVTDFENDREAIQLAFDVVSLHDNKYGALFTSGTASQGGIRPRTSNGYDLENIISVIMQGVFDYSYTENNLQAYPSLFEDIKFDTSDYFPGAVTPPSNKNISYTVKINGQHMRTAGAPANYETEDARRPTGTYLAPGSVAIVTVPSSLVGIGASVLVGAHTWDHSSRPNMLRMDRVTKKYEITSQTVTIANPLGGGIYINVPFENNLGLLNVTLKNVVRSPYYANTAANKTTVSEWQNTERLHDTPWTDFETDRVMMQVPTSWIYALNDPSVMLNDWDLSMDAISDLFGRPHIRSKTVVYSQVDVQFRGTANFPGYPMANTLYDPFRDYGGNHTSYLVQGPRDDRTNAAAVFFHELGHAEKIYKFTGEIESIVNFLWVSVFNKQFDVDLDQAFLDSSTTNVKQTVDEAAITWMITENFREGNSMSSTTGQFRQEFSYQPRGYAKYADIVRLFGWDALEDFYSDLNERYDNGTFTYTGNVNTDPTDDRILRMSMAAGYDLRPLIHFWGIHPNNDINLETSINASGVKQSAAIYDQLLRYKTLVPMSNTAFRAVGLKTYSQSSIENYNNIYINNVDQSLYQGFYNKFWSSYSVSEGQAAVDEIQNIINSYFPNGRPTDVVTDFIPDPSKQYYIDSPAHGVRLAATGESEDAYAASINTTGSDVEWEFVAKGNGSWHIQRAAGGTKPRLRTDNSEFSDMQEISSTGVNTYFDITKSSAINGTYYLTLPDNTSNYVRLQVTSGGDIKMVPSTYSGTWVSFEITEVESSNNIVHITKRNASGFAIDGGNGGANGQDVFLWSANENNANQQWLEINRGDGYYSYQKIDTDFCIDGGNGGSLRQNVYLWGCSDNNQNQHWQKVDAGDGAVKLLKRNAPSFAINGGSGGVNGQTINLFDSSNSSQNLQWYITQ